MSPKQHVFCIFNFVFPEKHTYFVSIFIHKLLTMKPAFRRWEPTFLAKLDTSYCRKPCWPSILLALWYISAVSSSAGTLTSPASTCLKSLVPRSRVSWYRDTWSSHARSSSDNSFSQDPTLCPGRPNMTSTDTLPGHSLLASSTVLRAWRELWSLPRISKSSSCRDWRTEGVMQPIIWSSGLETSYSPGPRWRDGSRRRGNSPQASTSLQESGWPPAWPPPYPTDLHNRKQLPGPWRWLTAGPGSASRRQKILRWRCKGKSTCEGGRLPDEGLYRRVGLINIPGHLTEPQQCLCLSPEALRHSGVIVVSGQVLVEVAVGAPAQAVRPLWGDRRTGGWRSLTETSYTWRSALFTLKRIWSNLFSALIWVHWSMCMCVCV